MKFLVADDPLSLFLISGIIRRIVIGDSERSYGLNLHNGFLFGHGIVPGFCWHHGIPTRGNGFNTFTVRLLTHTNPEGARNYC